VAILPMGKDPDECIRKDKTAWIRAVEEAVPIIQFYFDRVLASFDLSQVDNKKKVAGKLLPFIAKLDNPMDRGSWLKYLALKLEIEQKYLDEALDKFSHGKNNRTIVKDTDNRPKAPAKREEILSEQLLALTLQFPAQINYLIDCLMPEQLSGADNQNLYKNLVIYYTTTSSSQDSNLGDFLFNYSDFRQWLEKNNQTCGEHLDKLVILAERDFFQYDAGQADGQVKAIIKQLKQSYLSERLRAVTRLIGEMEADSQAEPQELASLLTEFNHLSRELAEFLN
jgi:DNA primase